MKEAPRVPRLRRLSDEEIDLWTQVAATVTPRPGARLPPVTRPPLVIEATTPVPAPLVAQTPAPPPRAIPAFAPIERTLKRRLSRGQMTADAVLDLHGFRQDEAYGVLRQFLARAQGESARIVLVVTGKGSRGGDAFGAPGVLRRSVPLWLALPEFRPLVLGFEEAARPHGGSGALYVRVRRRLRT